MIKSFRYRGLKRLYERGDRSRVNAQQADKLERILWATRVIRQHISSPPPPAQR